MLVVLAVDVQQFNLGYGIGVTSPMIAQLTDSYLDTEAASSWFASSLVLGQVLGTLLGGGLASKGTYIYYATWFGCQCLRRCYMLQNYLFQNYSNVPDWQQSTTPNTH